MIRITQLSMSLAAGGRTVPILDNVSLEIPDKQMVAIVGPSGSGKSTLLGLMAGLDRPTSGSILLDEQELTTMSESALARFRRAKIGYIFQSFHLIPTLTALENVTVPLELSGERGGDVRAPELLASVGLADRLDHYPVQLSGGEQQRVAVARAFACRPPFLFADEPTGNLDSTTGVQVITLLLAMHRDFGTTLVLVTHDQDLAGRMQRVVALRDGRIESDQLTAPPSVNTFILKMAWRETRAAWRHFFYFLTSIAVGVGALVGVSLFSVHLEQAVTKEARGLLGGDLEVRLSRQVSQPGRTFLTSLTDREITLTHVSELIGMAAHVPGTPSHGQSSQIVELKAVESLYPFYGALRLEPDRPLWELLQLQSAGCPGEPCWGAVVQESLLIRMGLTLGQSLTIGQATFRITGIVRTEPDRMANAFSLGPRVLIAQDGLRATELVKLGSRVRERYLLKTPAATKLEPLLYELRSHLAADSARVSTYRDAQPQLKQFLEQLTRYLGLIGLTALFVGGIGVATSVRAFLREKLTTIAILKTVGADSSTIIRTYATQALLLGLTGSVAGLALGISLEQAVPWMLSSWFASDMLGQIGFTSGLSLYSLLPLGKGLALGLLTTLLFTLWPLLAIRSVKPVALLRRDALAAEPSSGATNRTWRQHIARLDRTKLLTAGIIAAGLALLSMWQAGTWKIGLFFMGAFSLALALLGSAAWVVIRTLTVVARPKRLAVRHAIGNIVRPGSQAVSMTIAIGIGVMVIVTVALVERALLRQIGDSRPVDAPTFFFIDIQPDQVDGISRLLRERVAAHAPSLTPLVRSRLVAVNGQPVKTEAVSEEEERTAQAADKDQRRKTWYLTREYVLTFLDQLPKDNVIVKGRWWTPGQTFSLPMISIEEEAAKAMGLDIGQTIELDIQGTPLVAEVSSIRKVEWGNFSTNFYMVLSPGALDGAPLTYVATVQVPPSDEVSLQQAIVAGFPNVTAINIGDVLDSFARILDRLSLAIRAVALFCVLTGGLVMGAALAATRYRRLYESAVLKALGATRGLLIGSFAMEYLLLGIVGGAIGVGLASALSWALLRWVFELGWSLHPHVLLIGLGLTMVLTLIVGFLSTYRLLGQRPLSVLRYE